MTDRFRMTVSPESLNGAIYLETDNGDRIRWNGVPASWGQTFAWFTSLEQAAAFCATHRLDIGQDIRSKLAEELYGEKP